MRNFLYRMGEAYSRFMYGRYGNDELSKFMIAVALVLYLFFVITHQRILYYASALILIWAVFRCYSRRVDKRAKERQKYLRTRDSVTYRVRTRKRMWRERKTHKYIKCKSCGVYCRLPKGIGNVVATCPNCGEKYKLKS